jgi:hypothetical protein
MADDEILADARNEGVYPDRPATDMQRMVKNIVDGVLKNAARLEMAERLFKPASKLRGKFPSLDFSNPRQFGRYSKSPTAVFGGPKHGCDGVRMAAA